MDGGNNVYIIGTAGHVDHGKTKLIEALTGINTDVLPEEKQRGLTIDLGFAHFTGKNGEIIGVVDVPGHERFIRNMVAGAWSLDCALLVVAANEGWMRQSHDHALVLSYLKIPRVIVVVTKADLAPREEAEQTRADAVTRRESLGSWKPQSIVVSAGTDANVEALKRLIMQVLSEQTSSAQGTTVSPGFLFVDRVFSVKGMGNVVTGSLRGGSLSRDQKVQVLPQDIEARVRGIQAYFKDTESVAAGSRVALNLRLDPSTKLSRGCCVAAAGTGFIAVTEFVAKLSLLRLHHAQEEGHENGSSRIRNGMEVEIAAGTGHYRARIFILLNRSLARFVAVEPIPLRWDQPVLLIQQGGSGIICGGTVIWFDHANREVRHRLSDLYRDGAAVADSRGELELLVRGYAPKSADIGKPGDNHFIAIDAWIFVEDRLKTWERTIVKRLEAINGANVHQLQNGIDLELEPLRAVCLSLVKKGAISEKKSLFFAGTSNPELKLSPFTAKLLKDLRASNTLGLEPSKMKIAGARKELRNLTKMGLAVSFEGALFYSAETYRLLAKKILDGLRTGSTFTIAYAKDKTSLSRKYIIPLLNKMETDGYVRRREDVREVMKQV